MNNDIKNLLSPCMDRILTFAQAALPESQFKAFRKLVLDEFGNRGLASELERFVANSFHQPEQHGMGRNTLRKKGGVS